MASKVAAGESFSLVIPVLANIYNNLSIVSCSASNEDHTAVLPYHYVYDWLGEYFGTHFSSSSLDKSGPSSPTLAKIWLLMTKYSGVLSAKSFDDLQEQALFRSCDGLRRDHLARVGLVQQGLIDDSHLRFLNLFYLTSFFSGRQFGFVQHVPGKLKENAQSESLQAVYMHWEFCTCACTNASITLSAKDKFKSNPMTHAYVHREDLGTASDNNSSHSHNHAPGEGCSTIPTQLAPFDYASARDDSNVNFRHKKKKVFRPPQFDSRVSLKKDAGSSWTLDLGNIGFDSYTEMLFGGNLPTTEEFGDPPCIELAPNLPSYPSLSCVGEDIKSHIKKKIAKCPLEDLVLLNKDLSKLVSAIDNLNVNSSLLRVKIVELMATSPEYSSLHTISWKKLNPEATSEALIREREQLETEASRLQGVLSEQEATLFQHQEEISRLEQEKCVTMEVPTLSLTDVKTLKTLEGLLEGRRRSFKDIAFT
ncbi:unnamed protein product [Malus baccata var. baccata]